MLKSGASRSSRIASSGGSSAAWWAVASWAGSSLLFLAAVSLVPPHLTDIGIKRLAHGTLPHLMCNVDGQWYRGIASDGYTYDRAYHSSVVFFPAYPLVARALAVLTGLPLEVSLLIVSNLSLLGAFLIFERFLRFGGVEVNARRWALLALGFAPCAFFFHVAYTESMLLLLAITAMYGMRRGWSIIWIAACIGAATATRSVGIALLAPFAIHLWRRSRASDYFAHDGEPHNEARSRLVAGLTNAIAGFSWMIVACWGLIAFIAYQRWRFGDPLAFVKAQLVWAVRDPAPTLAEHVWQLVSLEPIRTTFTPHLAGYWASGAADADPFLSLDFMNPILFLGTALLIVAGAVWRWLSAEELALGTFLLLIPYVAQTSRQCMISEGRFAAVAFPVYLVIGRLLGRVPRPIAIYLVLFSGVLMGLYAALFVSGYELM